MSILANKETVSYSKNNIGARIPLPLIKIFRTLLNPNDSYSKLNTVSSESNRRVPFTHFEKPRCTTKELLINHVQHLDVQF